MFPYRTGDIVEDVDGNRYYVASVGWQDNGLVIKVHLLGQGLVMSGNDVLLSDEVEYNRRIKAVNDGDPFFKLCQDVKNLKAKWQNTSVSVEEMKDDVKQIRSAWLSIEKDILEPSDATRFEVDSAINSLRSVYVGAVEPETAITKLLKALEDFEGELDE